jgi:hypothetical protein
MSIITKNMKNGLGKYRIKILDILIIIGALAATAAAFKAAYQSGGKGLAQLLVQTPDGVYAYDMTKDRVINAKGALGISRIEIADGKARFLESPCRNKTCVQCSPISRQGEWIACLPNKVFIRIEADSRDGIDVTAQ